MASALKKISTGDAGFGIMQKMFETTLFDTSKRIKNVEDRVAAAGNVNNQRLTTQKPRTPRQQFRGFSVSDNLDQIVC